jgi:pilus assembly protein Flp/PilA
MVQYLKAWFDLHVATEEEGQGLVEYALILVLIAVAAIAIMTTLGGSVSDVFTNINDKITAANV